MQNLDSMTDSAFDDLVNRGAAAHQANQYDEALAAYEKAIEIKPADAEVLSLYGLVLTHLGRLDEAGPFLEKAVEQEPEQVGFRLNFVEYLEKSQQFDRAASELDIVISLDAALPRSWEKKGDICRHLKDLNSAANAFAVASTLEPEDFRLALKLASAHAELENFGAAHKALDRVAELQPQNPAMFELRCSILTRQHNWGGLEVASSQWADAEPENPTAWHRLTQATFEQGRYRLSLAAYDKVLKLTARNARNLASYGRICLYALELDKAAAALDEAEGLDPNLTDMLAAKGLLLTYLGRTGEAQKYCRRCLDIDPDYVAAYTQLTRLTSGHLTDSEMKTLTRLKNDESNVVENRVIAGFALAHGQDAAGKIDAAFETYAGANALRRDHIRAEGLIYIRAQSEARTKRLIDLFPAPSDPQVSAQETTPIFIVGMPRSGTTLVESMFAAHSRVIACGERVAMPQILQAYLSTLAANDDQAVSTNVMQAWADYYLQETPTTAPADHVTDKNPLNFEAVGLIARLFPNAVVINMRRNPVETGLSIFRHELTKFLPFTHHLEDIGHFYGQYARLADHWQRLFADRFITIQYEDFAANFDSAAPALLEACGLAWEDPCQSFQKNAIAITTFSAVQAREPVVVRLGKAKAYASHLGPLIEALNEANVDPETGALKA